MLDLCMQDRNVSSPNRIVMFIPCKCVHGIEPALLPLHPSVRF